MNQKRTYMPIGNYSYSSDSSGRFAISEPGGPKAPSAFEPTDQLINEIQAKEPDRPGTARRGGRSTGSRARMEEYQEENRPRGRSSQRRSSRRGTQARRATERTQARRTSGPDARTGRQKKSRRGFAAMSPDQQREIARKGGLTVSRNRRHMADIGRIGGEHSHGGRRAPAKR